MKYPFLTLLFALLLGPLAAEDRGTLSRGLSVGAGWPEARLRYDFEKPLALEAKAAFSEGVQVYSGRAYWDFLGLESFSLNLGLEGGIISFGTADQLNGNGMVFEPFVGITVPLGSRMGVTADMGPAWISLGDQDLTVSGFDWIFSTSFYLRLF